MDFFNFRSKEKALILAVGETKGRETINAIKNSMRLMTYNERLEMRNCRTRK